MNRSWTYKALKNKGQYTAGQAPHEGHAPRVLTRGKPWGSKPFVAIARSGDKKKILFLSAHSLGNKLKKDTCGERAYV